MAEEARFVLSKSALLRQYRTVSELVDLVSYSYKTNPQVGAILEKETDCGLSVHFENTLSSIKDKGRVLFLALALSDESVARLLSLGIRTFIIENRPDLDVLLRRVAKTGDCVNLLLRMRMKEYTVKTESRYVYGMFSSEVNELIPELRKNKSIGKLGIQFHRKTENISEWNIREELEEVLSEETLRSIDLINIGGGIPVEYKNFSTATLPYVFERIRELRSWANAKGIKVMAEPGRFIAGPCIELRCSVIGIAGMTVFVNCSVYNSSMDTIVDNVKLLVKGELGSGRRYLLKGCTPDSRDIFRYSVFLKDVKIGDTITFENAGAYTYTTNFCDLPQLETAVVD